MESWVSLFDDLQRLAFREFGIANRRVKDHCIGVQHQVAYWCNAAFDLLDGIDRPVVQTGYPHGGDKRLHSQVADLDVFVPFFFRCVEVCGDRKFGVERIWFPAEVVQGLDGSEPAGAYAIQFSGAQAVQDKNSLPGGQKTANSL